MNKTFSGFSVQKIHVPYPFHVAARRSASSVAAACDCDSALLKKPGLDAANMTNYRPVSHLSFISKVVERAVAIQLNEYLTANDLLPRYQSAYRKNHSTETALLRVWSDILIGDKLLFSAY